MAKKAAVMIYPQFSMQEISCLTDALKVYFDIEIDVFASKKEIICSEDSFQVIPHKTFNEFRPEDYLCLFLLSYPACKSGLTGRCALYFRHVAGNGGISALCSAPKLYSSAPRER